MTRDEIMALEGPELNRAVAEKILGWTNIRLETVRGVGCPGAEVYFGKPPGINWESPIPWSGTSHEEAWDLVERMVEGRYVTVSVQATHYHGYYCAVSAADPAQRMDNDLVLRDARAHGSDMPEAVARAALIACSRDFAAEDRDP